MSTLNICDSRVTRLRTALFQLLTALGIFASLVVARPASAASFTWTGSNLDDNLWSLGNNWGGGISPASPADLVFSGVIRPANNDDLVGLSVSSLTISASSGPFTIGGNSFTLTGNITN